MNQTKTNLWPDESKGFVDFHENIIFAYGIPKIGKTSLAAQFSDALFMQTEEGTKHIKVRAWKVRSWLEFCNYVSKLESNIAECPFKTVVIDTADNLSAYCDEFICKKYSINILGDLDYGKGYAHYIKEFKKQLNRLLKLGLGLVLISHADEKEINIQSVYNPYAQLVADVETGKARLIIPTLEKRSMGFLLGLSDMIFYIEQDKDLNRIIRTKPTKFFQAGDRSGRLPDSILMGASASEAYANLLDAYYSGNDGAKKTLIERINKAFEFLSQEAIDGFDTPVRVENSVKKHLKVESIKDADLVHLQNYLQHLTMKFKAGMKAKKEKTNA